MPNNYLDTIVSLTAIIVEETARLEAPGRHGDFAEMAAAKIKLVAKLETEAAVRERTGDDWRAKLSEEARDKLTSAVRDLEIAAAANARVLERQIDLSTDMMAAVAGEARRVTGSRSLIYGARGRVARSDTAAPISVNASL
jgi:hypothetical protein